MKRHRKNCDLWKQRDPMVVSQSRKKQTSLKRYGVEDASQHPSVVARRKKTNLERYGHENPMHNAEVAKKALVNSGGPPPPQYGSDNPFSKPEVQEKIKQTMLARYGVENPQQAPDIRNKTKQTNLERYGHEEILSSPEIREQIKSTCEEVYGGPAPSCDPEVVEKARQTNLARWGEEWTCQVPEVRQKQLETMESNYGSHFFASEEGKEAVRQKMLEKYGTPHALCLPEFWEKCRDTFKRNHPDHEWPGFLLQENCEINKFEQRILDLSPDCVQFTGNKAFWKYLPKLGRYKNPDFVVRPFTQNLKVIEGFGTYWHSQIITGQTKSEHETELIEAYASVEIQCLIIWESEVRIDPNRVQERIREFVVG